MPIDISLKIEPLHFFIRYIAPSIKIKKILLIVTIVKFRRNMTQFRIHFIKRKNVFSLLYITC